MTAKVGIILDVYDDVDGEILTKISSEADKKEIEFIDGEFITKESLSGLKDDDFAAVFIEKTGEKFRKYPVNTPGMTWLSKEYFLRTGHKMPKVASAVVANNITKSCKMFGVKNDDVIEKLGSLVNYDSNLIDLGSIDEFKTERELADTFEKEALDIISELSDESKKALKKRIDEEGVFKEAGEMHYAIPEESKYPLRNLEEVKTASEYFEDNYKYMPVEHRLSFASNLFKRAAEVELDPKDFPEIAELYASNKYSNNIDFILKKKSSELKDEVKKDFDAIVSRKNDIDPVNFGLALSKLAELHDPQHIDFEVDPFHFVLEKRSYDEHINGKDIPLTLKFKDEYYEIGEINKEAEEKIEHYFGRDWLEKFARSPVSTFERMGPLTQETLIELLR